MVHTSGFETSVDLCSKQTYSIAGAKRSYGSVLSDKTNQLPSTAFKRPTIGPQRGPTLKASEIRTVSAAANQIPGITEYSQRGLLKSTQTASQNPLLSLSHPSYGLPERLVVNLSSMGVNSIYPWQSRCLLGRGHLTGERNLVYTAPTGGGKSLVADILMLKRIIEIPGKKAILVLPYVALVQEKMKWLRRVVEGVRKDQESSQHEFQPKRATSLGGESDIRVVGFFGGSKSRTTWSDTDIAVCTIEKANSLVNSAIEDCAIDDLGVLVMDEFHMIDDDHRGYFIELMISKLLSVEQGIQIVGMSATLPVRQRFDLRNANLYLLAKWLNARFFQSDYRPVPIDEYLVFGNAIYPASISAEMLGTHRRTAASSHMGPLRIIKPSEHSALCSDLVNAVVSLTHETVSAGYGVLVFCSSRKGCENDATVISQTMPDGSELSNEIRDRRKDVLGNLRNTTVGLDSTLGKTVMKGVAFHHAGLTTEERDIVADAFDEGIIKVVVATCSLAAGINLPARRVILHGARMGRDFVGPTMLKQMRGRAGRKGKDEIGETYLCCRVDDVEEVAQLMEADIPAVQSCLTPGRRGIKRALLEVITTRLATSWEGIDDYIKRTLLYHSTGSADRPALLSLTEESLASLTSDSLISKDACGSYEATRLGNAIVAACVTHEDGIFIYEEIGRALQAFVMDGEMHIFYMFTPIQTTGAGVIDINWRVFRNEMDSLDDSGVRVSTCVGVKGSFVNKMAQGGILKETTPEGITLARIYRRFYSAFQLRDLCNEMPIHLVARKYDIPRGHVQNLAQACHGFAAGMIKFCERMGWSMLAVVLEHMSDRLRAGAKSDLLELSMVTFIKSRTARIFWENGIKSVKAVAHAEPRDVIPILKLAQPRKLRLTPEDEHLHEQKLQLKAEIIIKSASRVYGNTTSTPFNPLFRN
ncbi:MAG: hypothetical protein M1840_003425 [Geoglossum simile]|nr:MAG: hypothetical protein M1840_003425 [Geoglossum simile]